MSRMTQQYSYISSSGVMRRRVNISAVEGVDGPNEFTHRRARCCVTGALRDLLEFNALDFGEGPLSEGVVFGLAGGLGFEYLELRRSPEAALILGRTNDLETELAINLRTDLHIDMIDVRREAWGVLQQEISDGRPTMVSADSKHLEHRGDRPCTGHHNLVVVGFNRQSNLASVADSEFSDLQTCSLQSMNWNTIYRYDWPRSLPKAHVAAVASIRRAVNNMRSGSLSRGNDLDASGLGGIDRFATLCRTHQSILDSRLGHVDSCIDDDGNEISMEDGPYVASVGMNVSTSRSLHARFLFDLSEVLGDHPLRNVSYLYFTLAHAWVALEKLNARDRGGRSVRSIDGIASMEHRGVELMERWLLSQA